MAHKRPGSSIVIPVKGPPAAWTLLPRSSTETVNSSNTFDVLGELGSAALKNQCEAKDIETIRNPASGGEGEGEMLHFEVNCKANGNGPFPCAPGEDCRFESFGPWHAELSFPSNETFEQVELRVEYSPSGFTAVYHPPGYVWNSRIGTNALKSSLASGIFKKGPPSLQPLGDRHARASGEWFRQVVASADACAEPGRLGDALAPSDEPIGSSLGCRAQSATRPKGRRRLWTVDHPQPRRHPR
jgi:hypothetical protein